MTMDERSKAEAVQTPPAIELPPIRYRTKTAADLAIAPATTSEPVRRRRLIPVTPPAPETPLELKKPKRRRGHAKKDERGKWLPTGPGTGFASPPLDTRFDGTRKGPGRPKGSRSQSSIIKEELNAKRVVNENGKRKKYSNRHLATKLLLNEALDKKKFKDLETVVELAAKHFPEQQSGAPTQSPLGHPELDQEILRQLFAGMQLGEPMPGAIDPLGDALLPPGAPGHEPEQAWEGEEDWDAPDGDDDDPEDADD